MTRIEPESCGGSAPTNGWISALPAARAAPDAKRGHQSGAALPGAATTGPGAEVADLDAAIAQLCAAVNPALLAARGVGADVYSSFEGELRLSCRHDGKGLVQVNVTLGTSQPPKWSLSATMTLGAGAHLEGIADEIDALFSA